MKKLCLALVMLFLVSAVAGCGGDGSPPPILAKQQILSDERVDADIVEDAATRSLTVTQVSRDNVPSVFAGIDPATGDEYRAFIDFPLNTIPLKGVIQSATVDLFIQSIQPAAGTIPIRLELVSFPPPVVASDFDRDSLRPLGTVLVTPPVTAADVGQHVVVDVTPLVALAQARRQQNPLLQNFQLRVMEDLGPVVPGLIEIDESANETAPLLNVSFWY